MSVLRYRVDPRDMPAEKVARRLGLSPAEFNVVKERLYARGFPRPDPDTAMYDSKAAEIWMDRRSGLTGAGQEREAPGSIRARLEGWNGGKARSGD
jgi:hypothetical protein